MIDLYQSQKNDIIDSLHQKRRYHRIIIVSGRFLLLSIHKHVGERISVIIDILIILFHSTLKNMTTKFSLTSYSKHIG